MKLETAITNFLIAKTGSNRAPHTLRTYRRVLNQFARTTTAANTEDLEPEIITQFLASERQRGQSERSIETSYKTLQSFCNWLETRYGMASPIGHGRRKLVEAPKAPVRRPRIAEHEEIRNLLESIPALTWTDFRDRALILFLVESAARVSEVAQMNCADVDFARGFAVVHGKGGRDRLTPITQPCSYAIWSYLAARPEQSPPALWVSAMDSGPMDAAPIRGRLSAAGVRYILARRCEDAGIAPINPHAIRHYSATHMLNSGMDISSVQSILGHADTRMTQHYARWRIDALKQKHAEIWTREAMRGSPFGTVVD